MVLARSCALTAVTLVVATTVGRKEAAVRQQVRAFCYDAPAKAGQKRVALVVEDGFVPLLRWVVSWWQGTHLALALDATTLGQRFVVLAIRVLSRGCAIPVAWCSVPAQTTPAWRGEWLRLLRLLRPASPPTWSVIVLADRGLYARWLFRRIVRLGWHPLPQGRLVAEPWPRSQPAQLTSSKVVAHATTWHKKKPTLERGGRGVRSVDRSPAPLWCGEGRLVWQAPPSPRSTLM